MGRLLLISFAVLGVQAQHWTLDQGERLFAVVTHKAGLAASRAHNHLIVTDNYALDFAASEDLDDMRFSLRLPVADLTVDRRSDQLRWEARLHDLGVLDKDEEFSDVDASDRAKIRKTMLGADQLDAGSFAEVRAELQSARWTRAEDGTPTAGVGTIALTIHGVTRSQEVEFHLNGSADVLVIEAIATCSFRAFSIKPYSAFLGAVRNQDRFDLFVHLEAEPVRAPALGD